jgi:large subunit ribosomal protein L17
MAKVYDRQETKAFNEKKSDFKARTADIQHPLMDKLFNEIAPKYAARKEELGQGGGYTRIHLLGQRLGDGAEVAIIELV